jgi:hypothetical protein
MRKKHPLTRSIFGGSLAIFIAIGLFLLLGNGDSFWADGKARPEEVKGVVTKASSRLSPRTNMGSFDLMINDRGLIYAQLEVEYEIFRVLLPGQEVTLRISPLYHHVYSINIKGIGDITQDKWQEGADYQEYQAPVYWGIVGLGVALLAAIGYCLLGLGDWLVRPRIRRGVIVARLELSESGSGGYVLLIRHWTHGETYKTLRFVLKETIFKATEGADYAEVWYTPIFHWVKQVRTLAVNDFPTGQNLVARNRATFYLRYLPNWWRRLTPYSDGFAAIGAFGVVALILLKSIPAWLDYRNIGTSASMERYLLPGFGAILGGLGVLFIISFMRKLRDLKSPKKVITGPVLSKWRVNGDTNSSKRQIVVAAGGLEAGMAGVCKFDISNFLYEELQVGDIVEIEHTPRMRYIFRLEVKGHQELAKG